MEPRQQQLAYLEMLADTLSSHGYTTELAGNASKPSLKVANANAPSLNEQVLCQPADDGSWCFWWPWQQPIGSADDLALAADRIAVVLRSVEAGQ